MEKHTPSRLSIEPSATQKQYDTKKMAERYTADTMLNIVLKYPASRKNMHTAHFGKKESGMAAVE